MVPNVTRLLVGDVLAVVALGPLVYGVHRFRRIRLTFAGSVGVVADAIIVVSIIVVTSEILGTVGLFRLLPMVIVLAGIGVAAAVVPLQPTTRVEAAPLAAGERDHAGPDVGVLNRGTRLEWAAVSIALATIAADWTIRTADAVRRGITTTADSLWYHLPFAARFAHDGWTSRLHFVDAHSLIPFYPANSEIVHGLGMLLLGSDFLSPLLNLGWLSLALLAAWCIGRPYGVAPLTLVGSLIVLATPTMILDDGGSPLTDIVGIALFLAALAILTDAFDGRARRTPRRSELLVAALSVGLACGTKYTMLVPAAAITVAVVALQPKGLRVRRAALWTAGVASTGGYWYFRNIVRVGNPIPTFSLGIGPVRLPEVPFPGSSTVAHYLFQGPAWRDYLLPGLSEAFGPAWWIIAGLAFAGTAIGIATAASTWQRWIAVVVVITGIGYIVSPEILGAPNRPYAFVTNVRYGALSLILGLIVVAFVVKGRSRIAATVLGLEVAVLLVMQTRASIWRHGASQIATPVRGAMPEVVAVGIGVIVLALAWFLREASFFVRPARRRTIAAWVTAVTFAAFVVVTGIEHHYAPQRYEDLPASKNVFTFARNLDNARIGSVNINLTYPLYGAKLSNDVDYLAHRAHDGNSRPIATCPDWKTALSRGHYDYVVVGNVNFPFAAKGRPVEADWTASGSSARLVAQDIVPGGTQLLLYQIVSAPNPAECK